jgi:hypothetical protein
VPQEAQRSCHISRCQRSGQSTSTPYETAQSNRLHFIGHFCSFIIWGYEQNSHCRGEYRLPEYSNVLWHGAWQLEYRRQSETSIVRQRFGIHVSVTTNSSEYIFAYVSSVNTFPWQRVHKQLLWIRRKQNSSRRYILFQLCGDNRRRPNRSGVIAAILWVS